MSTGQSKKNCAKRYYLKNKERLIALAKERYRTNIEKSKTYYQDKKLFDEEPLTTRFSNWRSRAKERGIIFDLKIEQIETWPFICYYTGIPLTFEKNKFNTISLDRVDSSKGYYKENVVFCCSRINYMKSDIDKEEFINLCTAVALNRYIEK